jgi:hypothetical protein
VLWNGVAALMVNARCYEEFSSTGHGDPAQPHMATGAPETMTKVHFPDADNNVLKAEETNRGIENFRLSRWFQ